MNRHLLASALILATSPIIAAPLFSATKAIKPSATELLDRSIAYHDPEGRLLTEPHRMDFLERRPGGPEERSEVLIDIRGERFELHRRQQGIAGVVDPSQCVMTLHGRSELTDEEREKHRLSCDRLKRTRDYYTYLWGLPMKLRDPGTLLGEVKETTFEDRDVYGLRVTYDAEVGGDVWYVYFDRQSFAMVGYRFYHDESANDGEYIVLEGEVEAEGIRLPKKRTWYTHQDDRLLGTDSLEAFRSPKGGST